MCESRQGCAVASIQGKLYAIGGLDESGSPLSSMEMYDPSLDIWTLVKAPMSQCRYYCGAAVINDKLYVVGGLNRSGVALDTIEMYDPALNSWNPLLKSMSKCRQSCAVAALHGKVCVVGGLNQSGDPLSTMEMYDPAADRWAHARLPMSECRVHCGVAVLDEKLYVVGGSNQFGKRLNTMEIYHSASDSWIKAPNGMSQCRQRCGVSVLGTKICVIGGLGRSEALKTVEVYDTLSGRWSVMEDRMRQTRCGLASVFFDPADTSYTATGHWSDHWVTDPVTGLWSMAGRNSAAHAHAEAYEAFAAKAAVIGHTGLPSVAHAANSAIWPGLTQPQPGAAWA